MPAQVTNYKCPACGGPLQYDSDAGKLGCEYCGSFFDVAEIEEKYADKNAKAAAAQEAAEGAAKAGETWNADSAGGEWGEDANGMRAYNCPSCGAELICDETTAATSCPYCGNPTIVPGQFGGTKKPDYVIPFKLNKEAAVAALKNHYKGKFLLPKSFTAGNHIEEVKGVYVPFWLFDGEADADFTFHATRSFTYKEGDYRVTDTKHYDIRRAGTINFEKIPVDGSSKMPDDHMDSIEPFKYEELKEFSTAYLPGFLADKYDVDATKAAERADKRCRQTAYDCLRDTVTGYDTVDLRNHSVELKRGDVKYALLPVWMLTTKWKDQTYLFAMNGQTGKLVGDLPVDKNKSRLLFWSVAILVSTILSIFLSGPLGGLFASWLN